MAKTAEPKPKVKPPVTKGILVDNPFLIMNIKSIPNLDFIDDAGMHYFLEEVRNGEYVLRPRHVHTG
jgi:NADH:ubiquinone oxidoreductase subunit F (NADH-binding)